MNNIDVTLGINNLKIMIMCKIIDKVKSDVRTKVYVAVHDGDEMLNKINVKEQIINFFVPFQKQ
jgi:hypothetical protein